MAALQIIGRSPLALAWLGTVLWLGLAVLIVFGADVTRTNLAPLLILMLPVAVFGPVAVIWGLYRQAQATAVVSEEVAALRKELAASSEAAKRAAQGAGQELNQHLSQRPVQDPAQGLAQGLAQGVTVTKPTAPLAAQTAMKLAEPVTQTAKPISTADMIVALNFPQDANDADGFRALKRALNDVSMKPIVTAAQDVLTLLSQDGLYMDDLPPERARPEIWRRFAHGERGPAVGEIGGIRDAEAIAAVAARLRSDTIFRDTCLHFLRIFDKLITQAEPRMSDTELTRLGDTRSARAFMVVGRAIGTFS